MNVISSAHTRSRARLALVGFAFMALLAISVTPASADAAVGQDPEMLTLGLTGASSASFEDEMAVESRFSIGAIAEDASTASMDVAELATTGGIALVGEPAKPEPVKAAPVAAAKKSTTASAVAKTTKPAAAATAVKASVPVITADSDRKWSTAHLDSVCRAALAEYGVPKAEWDWVIAANRNIAYRESGNRPGARSASGAYAGLHQWSSSWGKLELRLDGDWSVYRFVKVYDEGGKSKIRQHWPSTVGL